MGFLDNLNFLATIGTFACVSFALSGMGVKLGKLSSEPHKMGYKYISDSHEIKDKLYDAIVKINEHIGKGDTTVPLWAKNKDLLSKWCETHQKSTRHWEQASQYCLIRNNVWHKLIEQKVDLKDEIKEATAKPTEIRENTETESNTVPIEECTYEVLNRFADDEEHINYLIGKRACLKAPVATEQTLASGVPEAQIGGA